MKGDPRPPDHLAKEAHRIAVHDIDWSSTCLGAMSAWPEELNMLVHLILLDPEPRLLLLGEDNIMLYNLPYSVFLGHSHPRALGSPVAQIWGDTIDFVKQTLAETRRTLQPFFQDTYQICIPRNDFLEEVRVSWTVLPLPTSDRLTGFSIMLKDETERCLAESRAATLRSLSDEWGTSPDAPSFWRTVTRSIEGRGYEFPFAMIYGCDSCLEDFEAAKPNVFRLYGRVGEFEPDQIPDLLDVENHKGAYADCLRQAVATMKPVLLLRNEDTLPASFSNAAKSRGYMEPCQAAVVVPVRSTNHPKVQGLLVLGTRTRVWYDAAYAAWMSELGKDLVDAVTFTFLSEETTRKKQDAARELASQEKERIALSEQFQRLTKSLELSDVGIFECDPTGRLLQANKSWYRLSGHVKENPPNPFSWLTLVHPDDTELVMQHWHRMHKGHLVSSYQMRWRRPGSEDGHWVLAVCMPVIENGKVANITGCITDIDAVKRVESDALKRAEALERAKESEQRLLRFTESAPVAYHICEAKDHSISYCNDTWFKFTGHAKVSFDRVDWTKILHEEDAPMAIKKFHQVFETKQSTSFQYRIKRVWHDGEGVAHQTWAGCTIHPELLGDGTVKAVMVTMIDISHLKLAEAFQKLRLEEALEAKRQQDNFIDMTSHEIRNPLGAVVHCADSISEMLTEMSLCIQASDSENAVPDAQTKKLNELIAGSAEAVTTIISCSAHQRRIVDDLLTLSKLDANLLQINCTPAQAFSVLGDVHRMFEAEAQRLVVDFQLNIDPSMEELNIDWVMLDTGRVQQILINLVTNAIKFTKGRVPAEVTMIMGVTKTRPSEGGIPIEVDFSLARSLRDSIVDSTEGHSTSDTFYLWFAVKDTGCGMTKAERSKLFARFSQGSPRTYSEYGGSGLGLFISRELAELQGGEIGVASQEGAGSTFAFYVKSGSCDMPPTADSVMDLSSAAKRFGSFSHTPSRKSSVASTGGSGKTCVLICEDNLINQQVLQKQLLKQGYIVYTADNGQEALDFLRTTRHWKGKENTGKELHVMLLDIEMPVMDGLTAAKRIRELEKADILRGHVPIIAVSANARAEQKALAISAGMDDAISKPFRVADLAPKIDRMAAWARTLELDL